MQERRFQLNSNSIKLIAIAAMTIDHIAWLLFPGYSKEAIAIVMHIVGRITCPIMCYFIAEGFHYTRDINKYTLRLFAFALISHFPYMLVFSESIVPFGNRGLLNQTSVMWSLTVGLLMLRVANSDRIKSDRLREIIIIALCFASLPADWSCIASLCVLAIGTNRGDFKTQMRWVLLYTAMYALVYILTMDILYGIIQMAVILSVPILKMYNGKRGENRRVNTFMKWFFYLYYPLHLLIIALIAMGI